MGQWTYEKTYLLNKKSSLYNICQIDTEIRSRRKVHVAVGDTGRPDSGGSMVD